MRIVFLLVALLMATPAFAGDYLLQFPGYSNATEKRFKSPEPKPGFDCEAGTTWAPLMWQDNDDDIHHYIVNDDHTLTYFVPPPPVRTVLPDPLKVRIALQKDKNISAAAHGLLASIGWMLNDYNKDGGKEAVQAEWAAIKGSGQISAEDAAEVEKACSNNGMPLVE